MTNDRSSHVYRRFGNLVISALTGQKSVALTITVYTLIALLLLAYVSAQVYTGVLAQEIAELKQEKHYRKETLNKLTSDYFSLSSRSRVTHYCESVLGMVEATDGSLKRFAVTDVDVDPRKPRALTGRFPRIPDTYRFTLRAEDGKSGR